MNVRVPARYALYVHVIHGNTRRVEPVWAFSAADVQVQFALIRDNTGPFRDLERIEPWREEKHGPWPEELT